MAQTPEREVDARPLVDGMLEEAVRLCPEPLVCNQPDRVLALVVGSGADAVPAE